MSKICYVPKRFNDEHAAIIEQADEIVTEYADQGFFLTIRQIYYQFIGRALFPESWIQEWPRGSGTFTKNCTPNSKRLGRILGLARLAGLLSWTRIEDRLRELESASHWKSPEDMVNSAAEWYGIDRWEDQPVRPEVWIEKDALAGVIDGVCKELDVPYLACRGYTALSEMWRASVRFKNHRMGHQRPLIIHLGDHDPSGIDTTRDIEDRINTTFDVECEVRRIALNWDQVQLYEPPSDPAKKTDSRFETYSAEFGDECWELDALEPAVISGLIRDAIESVIDADAFREKTAEQERQRETLEAIRDNYDMLVDHLTEDGAL